MKKSDDNYYIRRVLDGNAAAYTFLVDKYKNMAFTVACRIVKNREDAEEITQDAFLKAYGSLPDFKRESNFSTWLYRIVFNTAVSQTRKKFPDTIFYDNEQFNNLNIEQTDSALDSLEKKEQKKFIDAAINKLAEDEALIVTLYYLNGSSVDEISNITGFSRPNVKIKLFRARKRLFTYLKAILKNELNGILEA